METRRVYYAHCQNLYGTKQEYRDMALLDTLGLDVVNPNSEVHKIEIEKIRKTPNVVIEGYASTMIMKYFEDVVRTCEVLAFRALPDGRIPAGVATEIRIAKEMGIPIIELPSGLMKRQISVDETREYLAEIGQR